MNYLNRTISEALKEELIFSDHSPEELAKLAGAGEICNYQAGEFIYKFGDKASFLYVIISGEIRLLNEFNKDLDTLGGTFGEEANSLECYITSATSLTDSVVLQIDKQTLLDLKLRNSKLASNASVVTIARHSNTQASIKRTDKKTTPTLSNKDKLGWFLSAVLPIISFFVAQSSGFTSYSSIFIAIISAVILMWGFSIVEEFSPPLVAMVACILTGLVPSNVALGGFSSPALLTLLGVYALSGAMTQSGLSYRTALILINLLPRTAFSNQTVLLLSGYLLSFVTPSGSSNRLNGSHFWRRDDFLTHAIS